MISCLLRTQMVSKLKLFRSFLAVGLGVLAIAGTAEAGPITCNLGSDVDPLFPSSAYRCESVSQGYSANITSATYTFDFGSFTNTLSFDNVLHDMVVTISAFFVDPDNPGSDFLTRFGAGYSPATFLTSDGPTWIYFRVEDLQNDPNAGPPEQGVDYSGKWRQTIRWFEAGSITGLTFDVLHDRRPLDNFTDLITVPGTFNAEDNPCGVDCLPTCELCLFSASSSGDPGISGSADDFSDTTVVVSAVPEPATMFLVGSGLLTVGLRRRRANARKTSPPSA